MTAPTELSQGVGMSTAGLTSLTRKGLLATARFGAIDTEVLAHAEACWQTMRSSTRAFSPTLPRA